MGLPRKLIEHKEECTKKKDNTSIISSTLRGKFKGIVDSTVNDMDITHSDTRRNMNFYLKGDTLLDLDNNIPYVHSDAKKDLKMSTVDP